jgi:undecaprenyl-diphosphatase
VSLIDAPDRFSFPSGHAAASLCVALGLASVLPAFFAGLALGIGLLVGISRCYLGVHYPGDVLAGWILALAGASLAFIV